MKIAVIGLPRTGTTKLCSTLASMFAVQNLNEILKSGQPRQLGINRIDALHYTSSFVVKFLSSLQSVHRIPANVIKWQQLDLVVFTARDPLDAAVSHAVGKVTKQWINTPTSNWKIEPVEANILTLRTWIENEYVPLISFQNIISELHQKPIPTFTYDEICNDAILHSKIEALGFPVVNHSPVIGTIPTEKNYKELCINYDEVKDTLKQFGIV